MISLWNLGKRRFAPSDEKNGEKLVQKFVPLRIHIPASRSKELLYAYHNKSFRENYEIITDPSENNISECNPLLLIS